MNTKEKGKFNEALKLFDSKDYRAAKKACEKILDKQPTHADAMALKGLVMSHLGDKTDGISTINSAIKLNFKNPNSWHFFALLHKEDKNYSQAMKCYLQAMKNDPDNFNVVRDLSYLQLYLRQYNSFLESARKGVEIRSNIITNWATYAFANYITGNYDFAFRLLESTINIGITSIKEQEKHEIVLFQLTCLIKDNKFEAALNFVLENKKLLSFDKTAYNERVIELALKTGKTEIALEHIKSAFQINPENILYYINYFNLKADFKIKSFDDLIKFADSNPEKSEELLKILESDLKPLIKSRIIKRLELILSHGDKFRENFIAYFNMNVKQNLPSFFNNVKFIYLHQKSKIHIIESVLNAHLVSIIENKELDKSLLGSEEIISDIVPSIVWVYYYSAQHYDQLRDLEKALECINKAIDSTPSVVEFYMIKSKILKHAGLLADSATTYEKAKRLDLGDRFLNAKYAKIYARIGNVNKSVEIMKEFVRDPLTDENLDHFQNMWYEVECGNAYLRNKNILRSHRLFKAILGHFNTLVEDQFDFYNYCFRKYMLSDFAKTIEHMDNILDNKNIYSALESLSIILDYLNNNKEFEKALSLEYEQMKEEKIEKYKYTDLKNLVSDIESDIFSFSQRAQAHSDNLKFHHSCVKTFLKRGKVVLAFKSLMFIQNNHFDSFEYLDAVTTFNNYIQGNTTNPSVVLHLDLFYEKCHLLKSELENFVKKQTEKLESASDKIELLTKDLILFQHQPSKIYSNLLTLGKDCLRSLKSKQITLFNCYLFITSTEEDAKKQYQEYLDLIKIDCDRKDIEGNIGFYE